MKNISILTIFFSIILYSSYTGQTVYSATDSVTVSGTNSVYADAGRGFEFSPNVDVYISEYGKIIPNASGKFTWVIWNADTQTIVHQQQSVSNSVGVYTYETIDSTVKLTQGVNYALVMYCDNTSGATYYYGSSTQINSNLTYSTALFCNNCTSSANFGGYPTGTVPNYHYGIPDFHFTLTPPCIDQYYTFADTACFSYTSPSSNYVWTSSGMYNDTIATVDGCDSILYISLTIDTVDNTIINSSPTLTSNASVGSYQWLYCDSSYAPIAGETNQSFNATVNGNYAVAVTQNGCTDTSACEVVNNVSINEISSSINLHPNPTNDIIKLDIEGYNGSFKISIYDLQGRLVETTNSNTVSLSKYERGAYIFKVSYGDITEEVRVLRQ